MILESNRELVFLLPATLNITRMPIMYGCYFICSYYFIRSYRIILVFISSILLASTSASAGISTKKQDILKLIGTTDAPNGKFAWVEINGEDYGWTREGRNVGKYRIVMVEMGKVKLELFGRIVELKLLPEDTNE